MLIKELRLCNFLVFPGEQCLPLPTAGDTNLVVVLAPNNTGKTNIIRALKFMFYGDLPDCTDTTAYRLIHDNTRRVAAVGTEVSGWVEVSLDLDGREITLRRVVKTRKQGQDHWMAPEIYLAEVFRKPQPRLVLDRDGAFEAKLRTMVPEQLFDAFYFKGEPLDGKLLGGVTAIRESLAAFLHEDGWQAAEAAAEAVRKDYSREISRLTEKDQEYNQLLRDEELYRSHLLKEQEKLATRKQQLAELVSQFEETTDGLQKLGSGGDAERLVGLLREARGKLDAARKTRERADLDLARLVGASRGIPFLLTAISSVEPILRHMKEENIIPADVSERFVTAVLKASNCVCGRPHDDDSRQAWTRYKDKTLTADLSRGLSDLLNVVDERHPRSYVKLSADLAARTEAALASRTRALAEIEQHSATTADLEQKLQASPIEAIGALTRKLRELGASRERLRAEITQLEGSITAIQRTLAATKEKKDKARPAGTMAKKVEALERAVARAEQLRVLIQDSRELLSRSFYEELQGSVTEYYDGAAYDGSKARIHRATLLPAIETNGQVHGNLGGGQSQLLALAYIVSLSRLRKSLHVQMQKLGVGFGRVHDQSFFLDSPFNHVTDHYAHAIAGFLTGDARQVGKFCWPEQCQRMEPCCSTSPRKRWLRNTAPLARPGCLAARSEECSP